MTYRNVPLEYSKPHVMIFQRLKKRGGLFLSEQVIPLPATPPKEYEERFKVDFISLYTKLVVEIDGVRWHEHTEGQRRRTEHKTQALEEAGYPVLRFTDVEVEKDPDGVADKIMAEEHRQWMSLYGKYNAPYGEVPLLMDVFSRKENGEFEFRGTSSAGQRQ
jgi:hypothetical protein